MRFKQHCGSAENIAPACLIGGVRSRHDPPFGLLPMAQSLFFLWVLLISQVYGGKFDELKAGSELFLINDRCHANSGWVLWAFYASVLHMGS